MQPYSQPGGPPYGVATSAPPMKPKWGRIIALLLGLVLLLAAALAGLRFWNIQNTISKLKNADPSVRQQAARKLAGFGSKSTVEPLIAALSDSDPEVRSAAAESLGDIGDPRALGPLLALANTTTGDDAVTYDAPRNAAATALGGLGQPALQPLLSMLADKNLTGYGREGLVHMGGPAVDSIAALLNSPDTDRATEAAGMLADIKDPRAVPYLLNALNTKDDSLRYTVIYSLGGFKDARAVDPLMAALKSDSSAENRAAAASALGAIGNPRAVPALIAAIKDSDSSVEDHAAGALGEIADPQATAFLLDAFNRKDWEVIAGAGSFYIHRGQPGTEDTLIKALDETGSQSLAEEFLNSGNDKLNAAASDWASSHNYEIQYLPTSEKSTGWGK